MLPLAETYFSSQKEALEEAQRVRASSKAAEVLVKIDASPYGGFRLRIIPSDIALDIADCAPPVITKRYAP